MSDVRRLFFRKMIQDVKANASRRTNEGDKNSLLNNVRTYEYAFNNDMMDFDYYNDFHKIYFDGKIPTYIIAEIFDQVKKYTGINIPSYTREERRDRNCNILKGCMIYNQVYEHFKIFTFVTRNHVVNQDIPNETLNIPDNLKNYILQNWGGSVTLPQIILNSLAQINPNIYGVIMFRFYHLIFVIPIKKIKLTSNAKYKIIYTDPITIPNIQPPPQINPPQIPLQLLQPSQRRQLQPPHHPQRPPQPQIPPQLRPQPQIPPQRPQFPQPQQIPPQPRPQTQVPQPQIPPQRQVPQTQVPPQRPQFPQPQINPFPTQYTPFPPPQIPQRPLPQSQNPPQPQFPPQQTQRPQVLQGDFDEEENLIQWF